MSSGGGGSTDSTVTQTTTNLPEYVEPYQRDILERAAAQSGLPYETYNGPRIADFSPYQQEAMARMGEMAVTGQGAGLTEAARLAYNVGNDSFGDVNTNIFSGYEATPMGGMGDYTGQSRDSGYNAGQYDVGYNAGQREMGFDAGSLSDPAMLQGYMSPYMQNVVDVEKTEARRQGDITEQGIGTAAAGSGSLGGYREAIMRSENNRNTAQLMGDIQTQGQQSAYADAKQSYEADRQARAQAEQFGQSQFAQNEQVRQTMEQLMQSGWSMNDAAQQAQEQFQQGQFGLNMQDRQFGSSQELQQYQAYEQARQQAAQMGLNAQEANQQAELALQQNQLSYQQNQLQAGNQLAGYDEQDWAREMEKLGIMQGVGDQQQGLYQSQLDTAYNDFMRQQSFPWETLNMYNTILHGGAIQPGSTSMMYGPQASTGQQALGAGIAGLGLSQGKGG